MLWQVTLMGSVNWMEYILGIGFKWKLGGCTSSQSSWDIQLLSFPGHWINLIPGRLVQFKPLGNGISLLHKRWVLIQHLPKFFLLPDLPRQFSVSSPRIQKRKKNSWQIKVIIPCRINSKTMSISYILPQGLAMVTVKEMVTTKGLIRREGSASESYFSNLSSMLINFCPCNVKYLLFIMLENVPSS